MEKRYIPMGPRHTEDEFSRSDELMLEISGLSPDAAIDYVLEKNIEAQKNLDVGMYIKTSSLICEIEDKQEGSPAGSKRKPPVAGV